MAFPIEGGTAVITGAAGGIGAALAEALARRGAHLALADRDAAGLTRVAAAARATGVKVSEHVLDVADRAALEALPAAVLAQHGRVTMLVNNAGVALGGSFADLTLADVEWLFDINFWAPVRLTKAFIDVLAREKAAHIVNVSSLFGLIAPPGQTAYCAAKFGLRGFSESLRHELEGSSISLTVVHPGGIRTGIANSARMPQGIDPELAKARTAEFNRLLVTPPAEAAAQIVRAIERREKRLLIGRDARMAERLQRLFPVTYWKLVNRQTGGRAAASAAPAQMTALAKENAHG
jgi:short-subunit dehydrogenase